MDRGRGSGSRWQPQQSAANQVQGNHQDWWEADERFKRDTIERLDTCWRKSTDVEKTVQESLQDQSKEVESRTTWLRTKVFELEQNNAVLTGRVDFLERAQQADKTRMDAMHDKLEELQVALASYRKPSPEAPPAGGTRTPDPVTCPVRGFAVTQLGDPWNPRPASAAASRASSQASRTGGTPSRPDTPAAARPPVPPVPPSRASTPDNQAVQAQRSPWSPADSPGSQASSAQQREGPEVPGAPPPPPQKNFYPIGRHPQAEQYCLKCIEVGSHTAYFNSWRDASERCVASSNDLESFSKLTSRLSSMNVSLGLHENSVLDKHVAKMKKAGYLFKYDCHKSKGKDKSNNCTWV